MVMYECKHGEYLSTIERLNMLPWAKQSLTIV